MKQIAAFFLVCATILSLIGCSSTGGAVSPFDQIKKYTDIPGVTEQEINDIEALKANRDSFSYGALLATEAFELPDGTLTGFTKEFCALLTELFDVDFELNLYDWDTLIDNLESGTLDFTGELKPTEERMRIFSMTLPIAERMLRVFTLTDVEIKTESDINGLRIGFLSESITAESIATAYKHLSFSRVGVDSFESAAKMLEDREIDAFIGEAVSDPAFNGHNRIHSHILLTMVHAPVSMTTANPELAPIISVVSKYISAGGRDKLYEMYKEGDFEYAKRKLDQSLTIEERAYINFLRVQGEAVRVAFEHDNYPISFYNEKDGAYEGIAVDVLEEISRLTDMRFEPAASETAIWADILGMLSTGEVHMVEQLLFSEARRDKFIWSAVPYASSFYALMSKSDYPDLELFQVSNVRVGATKGSAKIDIFYELFPDYGEIVVYDTQDECLDALERGDIDLLMASEYMLLTQINYREKSGFKINIKLDMPLNSSFGFPLDGGTLCSIIDKAQQYVKTDIIEMSWTGRNFDYSKRIAEQSAKLLTIFLIVMLVVLAATMFILFKNVKLSKTLKEMAHNDALTGIYNRRFFMELASFQMARSTRTSIDCFIMIFDLDHFKLVNDTYGHLAGDEVLREVAKRTKNTIRPYDVLGRYGGEEFIIMITDVVPINKENALRAAERIRQEINKTPVIFNDIEIPVSASIGIAYAAPVNELTEAIRCADEALYVAKESGRDRVVFYGDEV